MSNEHTSPKRSWLRLSITIVVVFISVLAIGLAVMEKNNQFVTRSIYFFQHVNVLFHQMVVEAEQHARKMRISEITAMLEANRNESAIKEFSELERTKPEVTADDINKKFELEYTDKPSILTVQIDTALRKADVRAGNNDTVDPTVRFEVAKTMASIIEINKLKSIMRASIIEINKLKSIIVIPNSKELSNNNQTTELPIAYENNEKLRRLIPGIIGLIAAAVGGAAARSGRSKNNNNTTAYPNRNNNTNNSAKTVETVTKISDATNQDQTDRRIE